MSNRFFSFLIEVMCIDRVMITTMETYIASNKVYVLVSTVRSISFATMYLRSPTILNLEAMGDAMFT